MSDTTQTETTNGGKKKANVDAIEAAIARARAQQAASASGDGTAATKEPKAKKEKPVKEPKAKKEKVAKEPKVKKEKEPKPEKGPAHLKKVEAAAAALPALDESTSGLLDQIKTGGYTSGQLTALAAHVAHVARIMQTSAAIGAAKPAVGATVTIVSGDKGAARYVGMSGTLAEVRNIRCFVDVHDADGVVVKKGLYLFISDVNVTAPAPEAPEAPAAADDVDPEGDAAELDAAESEEAPAADEQPAAEVDADAAEVETQPAPAVTEG